MIKFYTIRHTITGLHLNHDASGGTQNIDHMMDFKTREKAREYRRTIRPEVRKQYRVTQWIMKGV